MMPVITPSPVLDLSDSIRQLNRRLDFDLRWQRNDLKPFANLQEVTSTQASQISRARFLPDAREVGTIAQYLARKAKSPALAALAKRARTTVKLLEVSRHV